MDENEAGNGFICNRIFFSAFAGLSHSIG